MGTLGLRDVYCVFFTNLVLFETKHMWTIDRATRDRVFTFHFSLLRSAEAPAGRVRLGVSLFITFSPSEIEFPPVIMPITR